MLLSGEKFQALAGISISKKEHTDFELQSPDNWVDVDELNYKPFDNPPIVYCNSSLISRDKPKLLESDLYGKLKYFQNPFILILHNSDQNFDDKYLDYLEITNCKKIFTQNINCEHEDVIPLPIGIANSFWKHGDEKAVTEKLQNLKEKTDFVYFNFTVNGGMRDEVRPQCHQAMLDKGVPFIENLPYREYIEKLSNYKYSICPEGNGIDTHRLWESLYLKVIPIANNNILNRYFSQYFPIILVDDWNKLDLEQLKANYETLNNWENYDLLFFDNFIKRFNLV